MDKFNTDLQQGGALCYSAGLSVTVQFILSYFIIIKVSPYTLHIYICTLIFYIVHNSVIQHIFIALH